MRVVWAAYPEWDRCPREQLTGSLEGEMENWTARMRSANETCRPKKRPYIIGGWRESSGTGLLAPSELTANWELGSLISSLSSFPGLK